MSVKERWVKAKPIKLNPKEVEEIVFSALNNNQKILLVYLFGSILNKSSLNDSDVDTGIYTTPEFTWDDYYELYGNITKKLHSDRLDLVWLNKADPIVSFEVIKNGKVLLFRDPEILNDFELRAKKRYYDYAIYLRKHRKFQENGL